jgi:CBS domain-containing protein
MRHALGDIVASMRQRLITLDAGAPIRNRPVGTARLRRPSEAMRLMSAQRQHHLAVVESGVPVGIVSLGDLMSLATRELEQSVIDLSAFISGPAASVELPSTAFGSRLPRPARH